MDKIFLKSGEYTIEQLSDIVEKFPNGISSYLETHYLIVESITGVIVCGAESKIISEIENTQGSGGLWELAESLTDKFELQNKDREWDGEFFDEIDDFLKKELYEKV